MSEHETEHKAKRRLPPRWFIRLFWFTHRRLYRLTGGRLGLWRPKPNGWGALWLRTVGRRTGTQRCVMVGYFEDDQNIVTLAMNGWGEGEPGWWLNLQDHPQAEVAFVGGTRLVTGRTAQGEERERPWSRWRAINKKPGRRGGTALHRYCGRDSGTAPVTSFGQAPQSLVIAISASSSKPTRDG